jgi:hypothetical protein
MSKQTAVEWLYSELSKNHISNNSIKSRIDKEVEIWKQAKAIEKEQIKDAWVCGNNTFDEHGIASDRYAISDESFYNETYGGDK